MDRKEWVVKNYYCFHQEKIFSMKNCESEKTCLKTKTKTARPRLSAHHYTTT